MYLMTPIVHPMLRRGDGVRRVYGGGVGMEARIRNEVKAVKTSVLQDIVPALNEIAASSKCRKQTLLKKFCKK